MLIGAKELCRRSGATYRQVDHWCVTGLISSVNSPRSGTGHPRKFDEELVEDVRFLATISRIFRPIGNRSLMALIYRNYKLGFVVLADGIQLSWPIPEQKDENQ